MSNISFVRTYYDYDTNCSKLYEEFYQTNGKRDGEYKRYSENNELEIICTYIDNKIEGKCTKYYYNYPIYKEVCNFKNNKMEGEYISYFHNGKIAMICNYKDDKLEGKCTFYYKNGNIEISCNYVDNKLDGEYISYYNGDINGKKQMIANYINDNRAGKCIYYHQNGIISIIYNYIRDANNDGKIDGEIIKFDENGNLMGKI